MNFPPVNFVLLPSASRDAGVYLCRLDVTARYTKFPCRRNKLCSTCTFTPMNNLKLSIDSKSELNSDLLAVRRRRQPLLHPKSEVPTLNLPKSFWVTASSQSFFSSFKNEGKFLQKNMKRTKTFLSVAALKRSLTLLTQTEMTWDSPLYLSRHSKNLSPHSVLGLITGFRVLLIKSLPPIPSVAQK